MKMNIVDPETQFPQVEKMLYKLAWKFANQYPVTFEEAKSEAYFAFMLACQNYNPKKGKFSTWCYFSVWCKLKDMVMKGASDPLTFVEIKEELLGEAPPEKAESLDMVEDLSEDAREIISLIVETPQEILNEVSSPKTLLKRVKSFLVQMGRSIEAVDRADREIRQRFQAAWK